MTNNIKKVRKPQARGDNAREARNLRLKPRMVVDVPGTTAPVPTGFSLTQQRLRPGPFCSCAFAGPLELRTDISELPPFFSPPSSRSVGHRLIFFKNTNLLSPRSLFALFVQKPVLTIRKEGLGDCAELLPKRGECV